MPVDGYENTHLWLYRSRSRYLWPLTPILDADWDDNEEWRVGVVERLQRGKGLACLTANEAVPTVRNGTAAGGWEAAEAWSAEADRSGSPFLNDDAIARRLPERKRRQEAYAEFLAEQKVIAEAAKGKREEEEAARVEAAQEYRRRKAGLERLKAEQEAEWKREEEAASAALGDGTAKRVFDEERAILMNKWQCRKCWRVAQIKVSGTGYLMWCAPCGVALQGSHAELLTMLPKQRAA